MKTLLKYINNLDKAERASFFNRCGTSEGYVRKAASIGQPLRESLCINIERESRGAVVCESLRPDVDWAYIRGTKPAGADANV